MGNVYPAEFKAQVVELHPRQGRLNRPGFIGGSGA